MDLATLEPGHSLFAMKMTISEEQVRAYLDAVEDDADVYRAEGLAPPMAVAALVMGAAMRAVELPAGAVHTGQELDFVSPVRLGAELDCGATVSQNSVRQGTRFLVLQITGEIGSEPAMSGRVSIAIAGGEENE